MGVNSSFRIYAYFEYTIVSELFLAIRDKKKEKTIHCKNTLHHQTETLARDLKSHLFSIIKYSTWPSHSHPLIVCKLAAYQIPFIVVKLFYSLKILWKYKEKIFLPLVFFLKSIIDQTTILIKIHRHLKDFRQHPNKRLNKFWAFCGWSNSS